MAALTCERATLRLRYRYYSCRTRKAVLTYLTFSLLAHHLVPYRTDTTPHTHARTHFACLLSLYTPSYHHRLSHPRTQLNPTTMYGRLPLPLACPHIPTLLLFISSHTPPLSLSLYKNNTLYSHDDSHPTSHPASQAPSPYSRAPCPRPRSLPTNSAGTAGELSCTCLLYHKYKHNNNILTTTTRVQY